MRLAQERARDEEHAEHGEQRAQRERDIHGYAFFGAYFDGHFVMSVSRFATKTPFRMLPATTISRPGRKSVGTWPW